VNVGNLLNGKGEIHDVHINCAVLQKESFLSKLRNYVALEQVHVSRLSFHVTSWTNLRKAPICIEIGDVTIRASEPLSYEESKQKNRGIRQITKSELQALIKQGLVPSRANRPGGNLGIGYNLFDRIMDNLTIDIASVRIVYQPLGQLKTTRAGPWTPPALDVILAGIRVVSVNEYGQEGSPEEVWQHNHHHTPHSTGSCYMLYKKVSMEYHIALRIRRETRADKSSGENAQALNETDEVISLISGRENEVVLQLATQRRIKDGEYIAVQVDTVIPRVMVTIPSHVIPHLHHASMALVYCTTKNQSFQDPFKPYDGTASSPSAPDASTLVVLEDEGGEAAVDASTADTSQALALGSLADNLDEESSSSSDEDETAATAPTTAGPTSLPVNPSSGGSQFGSTTHTAATSNWSALSTMATSFNREASVIDDHPILLFPNGLAIHDKMTMSVAIEEALVQGVYHAESNGVAAENGEQVQSKLSSVPKATSKNYVELQAKGTIIEAIWPRVSAVSGGHVKDDFSTVVFLLITKRFCVFRFCSHAWPTRRRAVICSSLLRIFQSRSISVFRYELLFQADYLSISPSEWTKPGPLDQK
jgi:N-terminal region of Chorein or VPS13